MLLSTSRVRALSDVAESCLLGGSDALPHNSPAQFAPPEETSAPRLSVGYGFTPAVWRGGLTLRSHYPRPVRPANPCFPYPTPRSNP